MKKILLATGNKNKIQEIKSLIEEKDLNVKILSPSDLDLLHLDPKETSKKLEGNAQIKAIEFYESSNLPSVADDTGLEVEALGGRTGVYSARYAGENASYDDNCNKLLKELEKEQNRKAKFRTVICYKDSNSTHFFEGECSGKIAKEKKGDKGFGYDPIFIPDGYNESFAELDSELKNKISHRGRAMAKFINWLEDELKN